MAWLTLAAGNALPASTGAPLPLLNSLSELQHHLLAQEAGLDRFRRRGPFEVAMHKGRVIRLSASERVLADWYPGFAGVSPDWK